MRKKKPDQPAQRYLSRALPDDMKKSGQAFTASTFVHPMPPLRELGMVYVHDMHGHQHRFDLYGWTLDMGPCTCGNPAHPRRVLSVSISKCLN